ncbi:peroxiredoxin family protein [Elizabethkingia anophelis]|uniref:peroxiredoxin family protein n=1 Tax=Elizabethkingia anophelis TaxID=1117645 RepID=UPI0038913D2B
MDILAKNIAQFNEVLASQIPAETLQAFQKSAQDLEEKQTGSKSLKIGERFPDFQLSNFDGQMHSLKDLLKNKLVIAFLRGSWCPYCNMEIQALQNELHQFKAKDVNLIVITPQPSNINAEWQQQQNAEFEILSDKGNLLAKKLGIDIELQEFVIPHYKAMGINLLQINQTQQYSLPIPAVYVLDSHATITYKFMNPDYMKRVNIEELLNQL